MARARTVGLILKNSVIGLPQITVTGSFTMRSWIGPVARQGDDKGI